MKKNSNIEHMVFLDVETVPEVYLYTDLCDAKQELWNKKAMVSLRSIDSPEMAYEKAGIFAEFAKIICVSVGMISWQQKQRLLLIHSFYGHNEKKLLVEFCNFINRHQTKHETLLCAHNGKEFDFPFLARRVLVNGLKLPEVLQLSNKKPWEIKHIDTLELWKFGDYKHYTSLDLLAHIFKLKSPKKDLCGSLVSKTYWEEKNLTKIVHYCQSDVLTLVQLFHKINGLSLIDEKNICVTG